MSEQLPLSGGEGSAEGAPGAPDSRGGRRTRPVSNDAKPRQVRLAIVVVVVAIIAFVIIALLAFRSCGRIALYDSKAEEGQLRGKTNAEIQAELDRQVDEGMFNISIASTIELYDGTSEGEFRIENVPGNHYYMSVTILNDANNDVLLQTGMIKPNQHIWEHALERDLDPGTYDCTAVFSAYDMETTEEVGEAAAKITIVVYH